MLYLLLATLCSASLALIFRYSEARGMDRRTVTAANYLAAAAVSLAEVQLRHGFGWGAAAPGAFWAEAGLVLGGGGTFSTAAAPGWAVAVGLPAGGLFYATLMLYQASVRHNGPALSGMFGKLGLLVPILLSLALFSRVPRPGQWAGMLLALGAVLLVQLRRAGGRARGSDPAAGGAGRPGLLPLLMLGMGLSEFSNKVFEGYAGAGHRGVFLLATFGVALAVSAAALARAGARPRGADLALGLAVGLPNLLSSYFLIMALPTVSAALAFPAFSAGSVVLIALGARIIYGDTLGRAGWAAVGLTAAGLTLMA